MESSVCFWCLFSRRSWWCLIAPRGRRRACMWDFMTFFGVVIQPNPSFSQGEKGGFEESQEVTRKQVGLVGRKIWDTKRKRRVPKARGGERRGGRRHRDSHCTTLWYNNWLFMIVMIQQLPCPLSLLESYFSVFGRYKMTFFTKWHFFQKSDDDECRVFRHFSSQFVSVSCTCPCAR